MLNIFKKRIKPKQEPKERAEVLAGTTVFTPFSGDAYANDIYRGAIDAVARNAAKITGAHLIKTDAGRINGNARINRLLQVRPNPYMSAFDMIYKMVTHYFLYNNAFAYLDKDDSGELRGIFPLKASNVEFLTDSQDNLYCKFFFNNGNHYVFPYSDVIHLRRDFNDNDLFGDPNTAISSTLKLAHTQNEGAIASIKHGAYIRGVLKIGTMIILSINQALNILDMPSVPDGDKRVVSLNYVNAAKADSYQLGENEHERN